MTVVGRFVITGLAVLGVVAAFIVGGLGVILRIDTQTRKNQHYTGCAVSFALGNDPLACAKVKVELAKAGIPTTPNPVLASERNLAEARRRTIEVDCLNRRVHVGLPSPDPARPCTDQTPPEVYPGELQVAEPPPQQGP